MTTTPPFVTIVSGSPRNGTALMMQMLMAGGLEVLVDAVPKADRPDPTAPSTFEPSLMLDVDSATTARVASTLGKAVKVMPHQLQYTHPSIDCRVLFICPRGRRPRGFVAGDGPDAARLRAAGRRGRRARARRDRGRADASTQACASCSSPTGR